MSIILKIILFLILLMPSAYADITTGLVGWWKFDDGSGSNAVDSSGNSLTGALQNTPTWGTGVINGDLNFDGVSQYVKVTQNSLLEPASAITVSCWVNITNAKAAVFVDIVRKASAGGVGYLLRWSHADGTLQFRVDRTINPGFTVVDTQLNTFYLNGWHLFTATYDSSTGIANLYVDTTLRQTTTGLSGNLEHSSDLYFMGNTLDAQYIPGAMDDVRIYNRAFSKSDVRQLYGQVYKNQFYNCILRNINIGV